MDISGLYNTTMAVSRLTKAQDVIGGESGTWASASTGNACRFRLLSAAERGVLGREGVVSTHRMYCEAGVDVVEKDRVVIGSDTYKANYVNNVDADGEFLQVDMSLVE